MTPVGDDIGPVKIVLIRTPRVGLEAIVVVDTVACGRRWAGCAWPWTRSRAWPGP